MAYQDIINILCEQDYVHNKVQERFKDLEWKNDVCICYEMGSGFVIPYILLNDRTILKDKNYLYYKNVNTTLKLIFSFQISINIISDHDKYVIL